DVDPAVRLSEAVTACSLSFAKPLLGMGDINGRIGDRATRTALLGRLSMDKTVNTRGRWLLRLCSDNGLTILNGTSKEESSPGAFTSIQALGSTVIDFVFASPGLLPRLKNKSI
ncbi:hypothetical protein C8R43DRAFT_860700, partial [Mycena crocata]